MKLFRQEPLTRDIRDFLSLLEKKGQLKRISCSVDSNLEIAAISDRSLRWEELRLSELEDKQTSPELFVYVIDDLMRKNK